ncbi:MAG: L-threonine 3-dehydrogenase [Acidimicrobiales bacterium]
MRALVKTGPTRGLQLLDRPRPEPGPDEVLVKVTQAAICGTDLHIYQWDQWAQDTLRPPVILGHEFVGTVESLGEGVDDIELGSRVAGEGHITCGHCRNCRSGDGHLCRNTIGIGIQTDGGFADFVVIPASNAYPIPDTVPDEIAAILDPLGNAVHTTLSFDLVGEDVLITGAGPIGQMAAAICRHVGARHVVVTDIDAHRLDTALQMGASRAVDAGTGSLRTVMAELGMKEGFDVAFEMSGSPHAVHDILNVANHGAKVGLLGVFTAPAEIDLNKAIFKSLTLKGIYGREMFDTWYKAVAMLDSGLDISPVISHRIALEDYTEAFELMIAGEANKVILDIAG